ncbi:hypothetical protein VUR80DRAFT_3288 [Thermomyces stellatus]
MPGTTQRALVTRPKKEIDTAKRRSRDSPRCSRRRQERLIRRLGRQACNWAQEKADRASRLGLSLLRRLPRKIEGGRRRGRHGEISEAGSREYDVSRRSGTRDAKISGLQFSRMIGILPLAHPAQLLHRCLFTPRQRPRPVNHHPAWRDVPSVLSSSSWHLPVFRLSADTRDP